MEKEISIKVNARHVGPVSYTHLEVLSIIALELKFHFPEVWLPVRQQKYGSVQFL